VQPGGPGFGTDFGTGLPRRQVALRVDCDRSESDRDTGTQAPGPAGGQSPGPSLVFQGSPEAAAYRQSGFLAAAASDGSTDEI
jgi:hypothetical protein